MAAISLTQARVHSSHGHHHHHHDNTYLTSTNKNDAGVRITRIGLYINICMAIGKGIGGYVFHSQALSADAVHSLTDLVSDIMTLATVSWALRPPTEKFPMGFGKVESLGSLGVSSLLLVGGALMGWSSLVELCQIYLPAMAHVAEQIGIFGHGHGHGHGHSHHIPPNIHAMWLAGGSVVVKEWLYRATMKIAKERRSAVLESNAVHHRVDSLTGIAALISIAVSNLFPTFTGMDAIGGLLISWMVIRAGWGNTLTSLYELADSSISDEIKDKVRHAASQALEDSALDFASLHNVQGIKAGQNYLLEVEVAVPGSRRLEDLSRVEDVIREKVGNTVRGARRVRVRFVPMDSERGDFVDEFISPSVSVRSTPEPEPAHHHHDHDDSHSTNGTTGKKQR